MSGVRHLHNHCVNHRQIRSQGNAIVKEARILQPPIVSIDIFFVQRPTDPLRCSALELPFHIGGMDRLSGILHHSVADDLCFSGFVINLCIHNMGGKAHTCPFWRGLEVPHNRPPRCPHIRCDLGKG